MKKLIALYDRAVAMVSGRIPESIILLFARISLGLIFWRSARTKVEDGTWLQIKELTVDLFRDEYGMPFPEFTGLIATYAEHFLPILVILGLFTRIGAFGLLIMTAVIQFWVYPEFLMGWTNLESKWLFTHIVWVSLAGFIILRGPGLFSVDTLLTRKRPVAG